MYIVPHDDCYFLLVKNRCHDKKFMISCTGNSTLNKNNKNYWDLTTVRHSCEWKNCAFHPFAKAYDTMNSTWFYSYFIFSFPLLLKF